MPAYSYTRINLSLTCLAAYDHYVNKKTPVTETEILQAGALAHEIFDDYTKWCHLNAVQTDITAIGEIARARYLHMRQVYAGKGKPFLSEVAFENVIKYLIEPFAQSHSVDPDIFGNSELEIAFTEQLQPCEWLDSAVWFRLKIDRLDYLSGTVARVTDYKSGWNTDPDILQMEIYAWGLFAMYPSIQEVRIVHDYVRFNVQKEGVFYREADFDRIDAKVRGYIKNIEAVRIFDPQPGPHCQWCNYAHACKYKAMLPGTISTLEQAQKTVEAICFLDSQLKAHKDHLREWVKANGNVVWHGVEWGFHPVGGLGFDSAEAFFHAAKKDGIDNPFDYMSVSREKCKKFRDKKTDAYSGHLAQVAVNQRSVKFEGKKA